MRYHYECVSAILAGEIPCVYCEGLMEEMEIQTGRTEHVEQLVLDVQD